MQDLMHDDEKVITAPFGVGRHKLSHNGVYFFNDLHPKQFFQFDLSWGYNSSDYFECGCVKLRVANLEVLKQDLDQAEFLQNENKGWISLDNDRE